MRKAAVEMPGHKQPSAGRKLVGQTAARNLHDTIVGQQAVDSQLLDSQFEAKSAETSLGAADTSVCATCTYLPTTSTWNVSARTGGRTRWPALASGMGPNSAVSR